METATIGSRIVNSEQKKVAGNILRLYLESASNIQKEVLKILHHGIVRAGPSILELSRNSKSKIEDIDYVGSS